jgi:hypothetical protein
LPFYHRAASAATKRRAASEAPERGSVYESSTFGTRVDVAGGMITEIAG